jgi:RNA polymerase sigma-70 factor (ECF subfamily)
MSRLAPAPTLVLEPSLRDNGGWIARTQIVEALPFVTSDHREQGKRSGLPLSSLSHLIKRSKAGEHDAMEEIYEHYKGSLFNLAYRYTYNRQEAEDLLQDIFVKVFTHIKDVQKVETFGAWVYRIALNACYSYLRSTKSRDRRTVRLSEVEGRMEEAVRNDHEHSLEKPLDEAIQQLPEKLKEVFLLHDVQGFKHEEIARMFGFAVGTSKSQLFKARMRIRDFLKSKGVL